MTPPGRPARRALLVRILVGLACAAAIWITAFVLDYRPDPAGVLGLVVLVLAVICYARDEADAFSPAPFGAAPDVSAAAVGVDPRVRRVRALCVDAVSGRREDSMSTLSAADALRELLSGLATGRSTDLSARALEVLRREPPRPLQEGDLRSVIAEIESSPSHAVPVSAPQSAERNPKV